MVKIEDPKTLCKGEISYSAKYNKDGVLVEFYVAPWVPLVVRQRLLNVLT
jgi:hypothetical protein